MVSLLMLWTKMATADVCRFFAKQKIKTPGRRTARYRQRSNQADMTNYGDRLRHCKETEQAKVDLNQLHIPLAY
jgi:hypothetical protein